MKKVFSIVILQVLSLYFLTGQKVSDSLLIELDKTILKKQEFNNRKEKRIDSLEALIKIEGDPKNRYDIYQSLFREYRQYKMNSALTVADNKIFIAEEIKDNRLLSFAKMNKAEILGIMGMYKESLELVSDIKQSELDLVNRQYYYHYYHSLYSLMADNSMVENEKRNYEKKISLYKDSILQIIEVNSLGFQLVKNGKLLEQGRYDEALYLMNKCYLENINEELRIGTIAYGLALIYEKKGDSEKEKQFLTISAISDLKKAVKGYIALRKLAIILYKEGDINRAYSYIKCSLEDASFSNARFRMLEISETLPIIIAAYDKKIYLEKQKLIKYMILITILGFILLFSILIIWRQIKKLSGSKVKIQFMYDELKVLNVELDTLNKKLSESNHVKEIYIGSIFTLYSDYINKLENYRINLNSYLVKNKIEEARIKTSISAVNDELKEFYKNFDTIFLNIYPYFIEEFNELLNEKIVIKNDVILTPELRVFALIRLGISDSNQIASFLHYSVQTVYNYRLKIKNKLKVSKEEFLNAMQNIGK
ncbi:MAG TPA: DUF6377 domain-containing protein [Saprospiraceae bacterium]|nr:DUF6377 domain-containing protein [Saprospiraceae bacterium]